MGRGVNVSNDGLLNEPQLPSHRLAEAHETLLRHGARLFEEAKQNRLLPLSLPRRDFVRVAAAVIDGAYYQTPNEMAIRSISTGPSPASLDKLSAS